MTETKVHQTSIKFADFRSAAVIAAVAALSACGGGSDDVSPSTSTPPSPVVETASTPWPGGTWTPGEAVYNSKVDSRVAIPMSDGTILRADVAYPTDPATGERAKGNFPVLITQTPYVGTPPTAGNYFVQRGYIFVTAYVRGTTFSDGNFSFFSSRDAQDGAEIVQWAATKLQSSNGKIGLQGGSYAGINQVATMVALGPNSPVKAITPYCMGAEFYRETYFAGGIPTQTLNFQRVIGASMGGNTAPTGAAFVADVESGGPRAYFGDFWRSRTPGEVAKQLVDTGVPTLLWSSSGDIYAQSSLELYSYLQNAAANRPTFGPMQKDQKASGKYQIIMSQGGHCANQDQRITLEWFDTWLKGVKTGIDATALPLHAHELVSNRWINTSAYPVVPNYTKFFLSTAGGLNTATPTVAGQDNIAWAQPAPTSTLQYETPAFPNGGTLAGPISASFFASSTTTNLELIATLQLVGNDGTITPISSGAVLGSLAANDPDRSWSDAAGVPIRPYGKYTTNEPVTIGAVKQYDFAISPRFVAITPGAKLRMVVTTQTPTASCTPVLGTAPCFPTAPQTASLTGNTTTLYYGPASPSSLNLPLLKAGCWQSQENPGGVYWFKDPVLLDGGPCQAPVQSRT